MMRLYTPEPRKFSEEEISFVEALAEIGAIGIENARMYERLKQDYETAREADRERFLEALRRAELGGRIREGETDNYFL